MVINLPNSHPITVFLVSNIKSRQEAVKLTAKGHCVACHPLNFICQKTDIYRQPPGVQNNVTGMEMTMSASLKRPRAATDGESGQLGCGGDGGVQPPGLFLHQE